MDQIVGKLFSNNAGQDYVVIEACGKNKSGNTKYKIKFINTNYERVVEKVEIKRGKIKDKLEKSVFGVGYLGEVKMSDHKQEYSLWSGILDRCYNKNCSSYNTYGGKGVSVEPRWHCFKNFLEDIVRIEGYDERLFVEGKLELDKDKKQEHVAKGKVYSLQTCCFITKEENEEYRDYKQLKKTFVAVMPTGETIEANGLKEFAKNNNLIRQGITNCLNGRAKSHKGWTFYEKENK